MELGGRARRGVGLQVGVLARFPGPPRLVEEPHVLRLVRRFRRCGLAVGAAPQLASASTIGTAVRPRPIQIAFDGSYSALSDNHDEFADGGWRMLADRGCLDLPDAGRGWEGTGVPALAVGV
jgi:hypothetical protein